MFYAPVLFKTLGFKRCLAIFSSHGAVNILSTIVSIYFVDKLGRRFLLLQAGVQMLFAQSVIAVVLGFKVTDTSENLSSGLTILVVIMICTFVSAFAWSWGPLGWLIPSETFTLETRSVGHKMIERVWKKHWLWKRFMDDEADLAKKNGVANNGL
ncbi:sugar transport protein 13 [Tanacetum coccineum]